MNWKRTFSAGAVCLLLAGAAVTRADSVNLFNTGVNASGTPLSDGTLGDPHYSLIAVPGGTTDLRVRTSAGGFPVPPYNGDDAASAWIGPNNDTQVDGPNGLYDYQTSFTTNSAGMLSLTGNWASDNEGIDILLDGTATGNPTASQFTAFTPFNINAAVAAGMHTLDFIVQNDGGPTAVRVEFSSATLTPTGAATPLPSSAWGGLALLGATLAIKLGRRVAIRIA